MLKLNEIPFQSISFNNTLPVWIFPHSTLYIKNLSWIDSVILALYQVHPVAGAKKKKRKKMKCVREELEKAQTGWVCRWHFSVQSPKICRKIMSKQSTGSHYCSFKLLPEHHYLVMLNGWEKNKAVLHVPASSWRPGYIKNEWASCHVLALNYRSFA